MSLISQLEQYARRRLNMDKIYEIRYTTTWRCNSKCKSCYIWDLPPSKDKELSIEELEEFTSSPLLRDVRRIVFSGGEPTMRSDLADIFSVFHRNCPKAYFAITLNGLMPNKTKEVFTEVLSNNPGINIQNVGLSINSPNPKIHDETRGVPGAFRKTMKTYHLIQNMVPARFSFTFLPENQTELIPTMDFAERMGTKAYLCWTVFSERFNSSELKRFTLDSPGIRAQIEEYCSRMRYSRFRRYDIIAGYIYNHFLNRLPLKCYAGRQFFHIDPYGEIFPCNFIPFTKENSFGNIRLQDFTNIWKNRKYKKILNDIDNRKYQYTSRGVCGDSDIYYSTVANIPEVLGWYLWHRLRGKRKWLN